MYTLEVLIIAFLLGIATMTSAAPSELVPQIRPFDHERNNRLAGEIARTLQENANLCGKRCLHDHFENVSAMLVRARLRSAMSLVSQGSFVFFFSRFITRSSGFMDHRLFSLVVFRIAKN